MLHYLVVWSETLVPEQSLGHVKELLDEFEARLVQNYKKHANAKRTLTPASLTNSLPATIAVRGRKRSLKRGRLAISKSQETGVESGHLNKKRKSTTILRLITSRA